MNSLFSPFIGIAACAGARNLSIIQVILKDLAHLPLTHHFDEREASFFALGTARAHRKPVAVLCTSGTAVSECYSAVIESFYSSIPLVVITADRPRRYRNTGAPQAIEQNGIFSSYCETQDIEVHGTFTVDEFSKIKINPHGPTHINFCIDEFKDPPSKVPYITSDVSDEEKIKSFFAQSKNPVVILSGLHRDWFLSVSNTMRNLNLALFAEGTSGLRESPYLTQKLLKGAEKTLQQGMKENLFDGILKIGSTPTTRLYRELDFFTGPILSIDSKAFSGAPYVPHIQTDEIGKILHIIAKESAKHFLNRLLFEVDQYHSKNLARLLYQFPNSEPGLINRLSLLIHPHDQVFLGNSLPIREWDLAASRSIAHELVFAQRGTNGIDGQLSNFLGGLDTLRHNFGIFGDLTTLYGNNALWSLKFLSQFAFTMVVINNGGGQIFSRVPSVQQQTKENSSALQTITNAHTYDLNALATFWRIPYSKIDACVDQLTPSVRAPGHHLIELIPDPDQTKEFWQKLDES